MSYKLFGTDHLCSLHDYLVSRRLEELAGQIDIIHTWPRGSLRTLKTAAKLGIPTVYERCNAHTEFAYGVMQKECERLDLILPRNHEYTYRADVLNLEEQEYQTAYRLLCPSDFVARTFLERGFPREKLMRHQYGYDPKVYFPSGNSRRDRRGLTILFVGLFAEIKGLHYGLEAWLGSSAHRDGTFLIVGSFSRAYAKKLASMLSHPSVSVLGYRNDVPELMRNSDILVLPSIQEGSALATSEARGSGCVLLVSEAAGATCRHMENALVHKVGDVQALTQHISMLHEDRALLDRLRAASLKTAPDETWAAAGAKLLQVYRDVLAARQ